MNQGEEMFRSGDEMDARLMADRGQSRRAVLGLLFGLIAFAVFAVPAQAATGHVYSGQFGTPGGGSGGLSGPSGVAIDQTTGEVFVGDQFNGLVQRFSAGGDFQTQWTGAATPAAGFNVPGQVATNAAGASVYVADTFNNAVDRFDADGAYLDQLDATTTPAAGFSSPSGVAVDPTTGDVYVADTGNSVIDRFDAAGDYQDQFGTGELSSPTQLAVDATGDVYVVDSGNARVVEYTGGTLGATIDTDAPSTVAVDPASGDVFVGESDPAGYQVTQYTSAGSRVSSFGLGHLAAAGGIAVSSSTGRVYVSDNAASVVAAFSQVTLPTVTTTAGATGIDASDGTISGTVNPEGASTSYHFDWGVDTNYGNATDTADAGSGTTDVGASAALTGLAPGTTYHFRISATNAQGTITGADETFTTDAAQAGVDIDGPSFASAITTGGATLHGTLNPNGADTTYHFEYGPDTSYGTSTANADAGAVTADTPVAADVTGLDPGTTYHVRLVADNGVGGESDGADSTFITAPAAPPTATNITATSATLNATVIPPGSYHFEYGLDTTYGASTAEKNVFGTAEAPVTGLAGQLAPGTTYHFRVVARINGQSVSSDDATFVTVPLADVATGEATQVAPTSAILNATVDTHGVAGTYAFSISSIDTAYGSTTSGAPLARVNGPQTVSVPVAGLPPGATFVARASAAVAGTTVWGDQVVFSTPERPPFASPVPPPLITAEPYGCAAPHLDAVNTHPRAGSTLNVTGSDLGVSGTVALGSVTVRATRWSTRGFTITVPDDASGTLPLTINCGVVSNTVALAVFTKPSNAFSISKTAVKGTTATLSIKVPGPGKIETSGGNTASTKTTLARASTRKVAVRLSSASKRALAKAKTKQLKITVRVKYTPAGGTPHTITKTVTFKRGGTR